MTEDRIFEIDLLRVVAIILMVCFHTAYDLNSYGNVSIDYFSPAWKTIGELSGFCFLFVAGISAGLSRHRIKRVSKISIAAILITIVTYIIIKEEYIRFGILHLLAICILLYPILRKLNSIELFFISILAYIVGYLEKGHTINTILLIPFGLYSRGFASVDYYPIFPYIAYFILGIIVYKLFYSKGKRVLRRKVISPLITVISKHSLLIYLVHQPIIIGLIIVMKNM